MAKRKASGRSKSLKRPDIYDALRRKGYPKVKAARISNAVANHTINRHHGKRIKR